MVPNVQVVVTTEYPELKMQAEKLSVRLGISGETDMTTPDFILHLTPAGLELNHMSGATKPLTFNFDSKSLRQRIRQPAREDIVRAVGVKGAYRPSVIDATAGTGQDAFVLASAGCHVTLLERSPIIALMLEDALHHAQATAPNETLKRLSLIPGDALEVLPKLSPPDVIYLDPMYPKSGKQAAKRKSMQFFRTLVGDDTDASELLDIALAAARRRVVVKRPLKAEPLTGPKPTAQLKGRTTRFDIYVTG
jgi:16S rRNA (guanine1516-N2)-methyltransferase